MYKSVAIKSSLEKILKAILIKMESGDEMSVSEELVWFDNLIDRLFILHKTNPNTFFEVIDPDKYFRIETTVDPSRISLKEGNATAKKAYLITPIEAEYGLLDTFYSFTKKIWDLAIKIDRNEVSIRVRRSYGKLYYLISKFSDPQFKYTTFYKFFFDKLFLRILFLLQKDSVSKSDSIFANYLLIQCPLESFSSESFPVANVEFIQRVLFTGLKIGVDMGQDEFVKEYVRSATHLPFHQFWPREADNFENLVYEKLGPGNSLSKPINQIVNFRAKSVFTQKDYQEIIDSLNEMKGKVKEIIQDLTATDKLNIDISINEIIKYSFHVYKRKQVQKALNHALIYCIFKKRYELVDFAFDFHTPPDANASFSNYDVIFNDLSDILRLVSLGHEIENELMFLWPDHHGTTIYINTYLIALINRWSLAHTDLEYQVPLAVSKSIAFENLKNTFNKEMWIGVIDDLEKLSLKFISQNHWPFIVQNEASVNRFTTCMMIIKNQFHKK